MFVLEIYCFVPLADSMVCSDGKQIPMHVTCM